VTVTSSGGQGAGRTAEGGADQPQVFTSRLSGRPLLDNDDLAIGRVRDVVIWPLAGDEPPRALGLVVAVAWNAALWVWRTRVIPKSGNRFSEKITRK